jgi:transcriptional regulator with XRE-family HTH domain
MFPLSSLRRVRLARLMSQADLATRADVTEIPLSRIENGLPARLSTIRKLAAALNVEAHELMAEEQGEAVAAA